MSLFRAMILVLLGEWCHNFLCATQALSELYFLFTELAEEDKSWNPWGEEFENEQPGEAHHQVPNIDWNMESEPKDKNLSDTNKIFHVEVWGKAAIGKIIYQHCM